MICPVCNDPKNYIPNSFFISELKRLYVLINDGEIAKASEKILTNLQTLKNE